ncbi:MAG: ABC transporter substrate-binding protein [Candidatus Falkowbacteria bacterium]
MKKNIAIGLIVTVVIVLIGVLLYIYIPNNFKSYFSGKNGGDSALSEDPSWNNVLKRGELIVGVNMPYGSMEFLNEQGEADGFDIDIIKEVASRLGLKARIVNYEWDNLFPAVKSGEVDAAISGIGITVDRGAEMLFSTPYINAGAALIVKKDNESIKGAGDLVGKKVGAQKDTIGIEEARKLTNPELVIAYDDYSDKIIEDLKNGEIDVILLGYEAVSGVIKANSDLKMACPPINEGFVGIPTKLGNKSFMTRIDKTLKEMKADGTINKIEDKWLAITE